MQFYAFEVRLICSFGTPHVPLTCPRALQIARNRLGLNDRAHELAKEEAAKEKAKAEATKAKGKKKANGTR